MLIRHGFDIHGIEDPDVVRQGGCRRPFAFEELLHIPIFAAAYAMARYGDVTMMQRCLYRGVDINQRCLFNCKGIFRRTGDNDILQGERHFTTPLNIYLSYIRYSGSSLPIAGFGAVDGIEYFRRHDAVLEC